MSYLNQFSMPSKVWYERGISQASTFKSDRTTVCKILSFPGINPDAVEKIIVEQGS